MRNLITVSKENNIALVIFDEDKKLLNGNDFMFIHATDVNDWLNGLEVDTETDDLFFAFDNMVEHLNCETDYFAKEELINAFNKAFNKAPKVNLYLDGKETTEKEVKEMLGEERFNKMLNEAKEGYENDPLEIQSYFIGCGILTFEF